MNPFSPYTIVGAVLVFLGGMAAGVKVHSGLIAERDLAAAQQAAHERIRQAEFAAPVAQAHAETVETLNQQLVEANAEIATLQSRACLDPRAVRVLNATGVPHRPAATEPASAASGPTAAGGDAAAGADAQGTGLKWASNIDVGQYIAYCRAQYGKIADQLNSVLDIEDKRFPPAPRSP